MAWRERRPSSVRHLAQLAMVGVAAPAFALPSPTPGGQVQLHLLRFCFRAPHPRPRRHTRDSILLGDRFYRGGPTLLRQVAAMRDRRSEVMGGCAGPLAFLPQQMQPTTVCEMDLP